MTNLVYEYEAELNIMAREADALRCELSNARDTIAELKASLARIEYLVQKEKEPRHVPSL